MLTDKRCVHVICLPSGLGHLPRKETTILLSSAQGDLLRKMQHYKGLGRQEDILLHFEIQVLRRSTGMTHRMAREELTTIEEEGRFHVPQQNKNFQCTVQEHPAILAQAEAMSFQTCITNVSHRRIAIWFACWCFGLCLKGVAFTLSLCLAMSAPVSPGLAAAVVRAQFVASDVLDVSKGPTDEP